MLRTSRLSLLAFGLATVMAGCGKDDNPTSGNPKGGATIPGSYGGLVAGFSPKKFTLQVTTSTTTRSSKLEAAQDFWCYGTNFTLTYAGYPVESEYVFGFNDQTNPTAYFFVSDGVGVYAPNFQQAGAVPQTGEGGYNLVTYGTFSAPQQYSAEGTSFKYQISTTAKVTGLNISTGTTTINGTNLDAMPWIKLTDLVVPTGSTPVGAQHRVDAAIRQVIR